MNQPVVEPGQSANVRGKYWITSEPSQLDVSAIHEYLSQHAYWAIGRSLETVERSIAHSLCCGLFCGRQQVGFARLVTDYATYGYLCDVYILEAHRGLGLGMWLVQSLLEHPTLPPTMRFTLRTRDAHDLYRRFGFSTVTDTTRYMVRPPRSP